MEGLIGILLVIALIPAAIAMNKGRNFLLWYIYGLALWIVALIHAIMLKSDEQIKRETAFARGGSPAEEIARFAALKEQGVITEAEFAAKKRELLA